MSNRTDKDFLLDIQEAIRRIKSYTHEMRYEEFLNYFGVDIEIVWQIVITELSDLALQIAKISANSSATNAKS